MTPCTAVLLWCVCGYTPVSGREGLYTAMYTCSLVVCVWLHTCLRKGGIVHWYVQVFSCRVCGYTPVSGRGEGSGTVDWYVHLFSCDVCGYTPVSGREGLYTGMYTCFLVVCVWLHTCLGKGGIVHWYVHLFSCGVCVVTHLSREGRDCTLVCTGVLLSCMWLHTCLGKGEGSGAVHWYVQLFSCGVCGYTPVSGREGLCTGMYRCSFVVSVVTHLSREGGRGAVHWYVQLFSCGVYGYTPVSGRGEGGCTLVCTTVLLWCLWLHTCLGKGGGGLYTGMYNCSLVVSVVTHLSREGGRGAGL